MMIKYLILLIFVISAWGTSIYDCVNHHNNCPSCIAKEGCGFCGVFGGEGWCVPGTSAGSQISQFGFEECPTEFWKFQSGTGGCFDPIRQVSLNVTEDKIEWVSVAAYGPTSSQVEIDVVLFVLSKEVDPKDGRRRPLLFTGFGTGDLQEINYELFAVGFDHIIEYLDESGTGFNCTTITDGDFSECPDIGNIRAFPNITAATLHYSAINGTLPGTIIHIGKIVSDDSKFEIECRLSNGDFEYEGLQLNPFEMKCDVKISDWVYVDPADSLALQTFILSAQLVEVPDSGQEPTGVITVGREGGGFFRWSKIVNASSNTYPVVKSDILLTNETFDIDPNADIYTTIFSFLAPGETNLLWDPEVGINVSRNFNFEDPGVSSNSSDECFIATAAYGSLMDEHVWRLRVFRDQYLLTNPLGSKFVETYYSLSPPMAKWISEHEWARGLVRTILWPIVTILQIFLQI